MSDMASNPPTEPMFSAIAARYDRCNRLFSAGIDRFWRRRLVAAMGLADGQTVLDVGCGTGDMALAVLRQCPNCRLVGVDCSEKMLHLAQEKTILWSSRRGVLPTAEWRLADAARLPFADGQFDAAVCAFSLRNIPNRHAALADICRVLKKGAKIGICEFSMPNNRFLYALYHFYLVRLMPSLGRLVLGQSEPLRYLAESILRWHQTVRLSEMLSGVGFGRTQTFYLTGRIAAITTAVKL